MNHAPPRKRSHARDGSRETQQTLSLGGAPTARWYTSIYAAWAWTNHLPLTTPGASPGNRVATGTHGGAGRLPEDPCARRPDPARRCVAARHRQRLTEERPSTAAPTRVLRRGRWRPCRMPVVNGIGARQRPGAADSRRDIAAARGVWHLREDGRRHIAPTGNEFDKLSAAGERRRSRQPGAACPSSSTRPRTRGPASGGP